MGRLRLETIVLHKVQIVTREVTANMWTVTRRDPKALRRSRAVVGLDALGHIAQFLQGAL